MQTDRLTDSEKHSKARHYHHKTKCW